MYNFKVNKMNKQSSSKQTFVQQKIQLCIPVLLLIFFLVSSNSISCNLQLNSPQVKAESNLPTIISEDSIDAVVKSIIDISADDFYKNQQPLPTEFRNVQFRYSIKPNNEVLYILCGEFTTQDIQKNNEWTHFTTIKNSDYEQWIGPNGLTYCENSNEITYKKADLSNELKKQLNSIQKNNK